MKINFYGAARRVTGTKHLITTEQGTKILLDCGLFQGINTQDLNQNLGFSAKDIDFVILSHAHIDHAGLLPRLVRQGYRGPIYCTPPTADLCNIMLLDSAFIQQKDLERINNVAAVKEMLYWSYCTTKMMCAKRLSYLSRSDTTKIFGSIVMK